MWMSICTMISALNVAATAVVARCDRRKTPTLHDDIYPSLLSSYAVVCIFAYFYIVCFWWNNETVGDSLQYHNDHSFSTFDNDNDAAASNCAEDCKGGWWYSACHYSNLNGLYLRGQRDTIADGVNWWTWHRNYHYSLKFTEMKIRPIFRDCADILYSGLLNSGVYTVHVNGDNFQVFCDMTTEGGGWLVIATTQNTSVFTLLCFSCFF